MKIAVYNGKEGADSDLRLTELKRTLERRGCLLYEIVTGGSLSADTDMVLSVGGDGTFLSVAALVADRGIPVAGVNLGRLGFLSENKPEDVADALLDGRYDVEKRSLLYAETAETEEKIDIWPYALNEFTVRRTGTAMLGVDVSIDGSMLPTYWADGLVISTSSGSTAYSLSVGGPIVIPESRVLIISPIAPHNLNVRPLVVPDSSVISLKMTSRDSKFEFSADNRSLELSVDTRINISLARFSLNRVRLHSANFVHALTEKLFWGEDVRNIK